MQLLPPAKFINALTKDVVTVSKLAGVTFSEKDLTTAEKWKQTKKYRKDFKGFETPASVPLVGKFYYWRFGKGSKITEEKEKKERKGRGTTGKANVFSNKLLKPAGKKNVLSKSVFD
jgi:hypothetical protein